MADSGELDIPPKLKAVRPYVLLAKDHDQKDKVMAYYCRRHAMESALDLDKQNKDPLHKAFLFSLMDKLEESKQALKDNDVMGNELASQVHVENSAMRVFTYADNKDRAGDFSKTVVKAFYKSGLMFDVMQTFGELSDELQKTRKYAKWKVTDITGCQKRGETPHAGPLGEEADEDTAGAGSNEIAFPVPPQQPSPYPPMGGQQPSPSPYPPPASQPPAGGLPAINQSLIPPGMHAPPSTPEQPGVYGVGLPGPQPTPPSVESTNTGYPKLSSDSMSKAQKYCKYASSSLQYSDIPTAVDYLEKVLRLLKTGQE